MAFSLSGYEKIGNGGADSDVYKRLNSDYVVKIYDPSIPIQMIEAYHRLQTESSKLCQNGNSSGVRGELLTSDRIFYQGQIVSGIVCSILDLDPNEVFFGKVEGLDSPRVLARAKFIEGDTLYGHGPYDPLIREIESKLCLSYVPIGTGLQTFKIDGMNVKVENFHDGILSVKITDLAANIKISMAGLY